MPTEKAILELFREIMLRCKQERKLKMKRTLRSITRDIGITENYLNAVENGREFPSLPVFLKYLLVCGFDTTVLTQLAIKQLPETATPEQKKRHALAEKIYSYEGDQINFMLEQAKLAESFSVRMKRKKS